MSHARRQVELVLTFLGFGRHELESLFPEGVTLHPSSAGGTLAVIGSRKPSGQPAEVLLSDLWTSVSPILTRLESAGYSPDAMLLRLVQYIGANDEVGPGVPVDAQWIEMLARFHGAIDIDQYVEEVPSDGQSASSR